MSVAIITGAGGLIGAEAAKFFNRKGLVVVGIDNDMRAKFFGPDASTRWSWERQLSLVPLPLVMGAAPARAAILHPC